MSEEREKFVLAFYVLETNLQVWIDELQRDHDHKKAEIVHEDDYQMGYLHGTDSAIAYLKYQLEGVKERQNWIKDNND